MKTLITISEIANSTNGLHVTLTEGLTLGVIVIAIILTPIFFLVRSFNRSLEKGKDA